jgi:hypothetical protein
MQRTRQRTLHHRVAAHRAVRQEFARRIDVTPSRTVSITHTTRGSFRTWWLNATIARPSSRDRFL